MLLIIYLVRECICSTNPYALFLLFGFLSSLAFGYWFLFLFLLLKVNFFFLFSIAFGSLVNCSLIFVSESNLFSFSVFLISGFCVCRAFGSSGSP